MDKPSTMSTREWIMKKISIEQDIPHNIVRTVINDMFREANSALLDNNSVEIAGFGRFTFNEKKAHQRMEKYESQIKMFNKKILDPNTTDIKKKGFVQKLKTTQRNIEHINHKLYGSEKD